MKSMVRTIAALVAGVLAWKAVAWGATFAGRFIWPDYAAVEMDRTFSLDMLLSRLAVGALATLAFGAAAAWVVRGDRRAMGTIIGAWLLFSVVDHYMVWDQFPVWYHLVYLAYVVPLTVLGGWLIFRRF